MGSQSKSKYHHYISVVVPNKGNRYHLTDYSSLVLQIQTGDECVSGTWSDVNQSDERSPIDSTVKNISISSAPPLLMFVYHEQSKYGKAVIPTISVGFVNW